MGFPEAVRRGDERVPASRGYNLLISSCLVVYELLGRTREGKGYTGNNLLLLILQ